MVRLINKLKNRQGFTLIELIVVLAVLSIIMAIAVPRFVGVQEVAKVSADESTAAMIGKAAELYAAINSIESGNIALSKLTEDGKYMDENTKFQYYENEGGIADVEISIDNGAATVKARTSSSASYTKIYPKN